MAAQMQNLQQQLDEQRLATAQAQQEIHRRDKDGVDLHPEVLACVPPHLQLKPMDASDRSKVLRGYPKVRKGPKPLTDENGLAGKLLQDSKQKQVITKDLPQQQRDDLDVLRVASQGWSAALRPTDPTQALQQACQALRDVTVIVCDNAARKAKQQLQLTFEAVDAKGAYAICDMDPRSDDCEIDSSCHSVIQDVHVEAITRIKKLSNSCKGKSSKPKNAKMGSKPTYQQSSFRSGFNRNGRSGPFNRGPRRDFNNRPAWTDNNNKAKSE